MVGAIYLAPWLRNENIAEVTDPNLNWLLLSTNLWNSNIYFSGQYKQLTRFTDSIFKSIIQKFISLIFYIFMEMSF